MLARLHIPEQFDGSLWRYANAATANKRHRHIELELNMVTRGRGSYLLGNRRYEIRRGDLLWLFPAEEHVLFEQTADFEMWIAVFRRRGITRVATDAAARPLLQRSLSGDTCRRLGARELSNMEALFAALSSATGASLVNAGLGYALLHAWNCFEHAAEVPVRELHPAVDRAARMISSGAFEGGLELLAQRAGLSPSRLSRLFKEQTGTSLVEFRNRQRIERFQTIYGDGTRHTLLDAALEAGFGSYPQFHRVFRVVLGCSPAEYTRARRV